jgi:hypothetical protein
MARLYIKQYATLASDGNGATIPVGQEPAISESTVDIELTANQSGLIDANCNYVRLYADAACHLAFGENPTATTDQHPLGAGGMEYVGIADKTGSWKISVIGD